MPRKRDRDRADKAMLNEARADDFAQAAVVCDRLDDSRMSLVQRRLFQLAAAVMRERAAAAALVEGLDA